MNRQWKLLSVLLIGVWIFSTVHAQTENNSSKAIYVTPSAPTFSDAERQAELVRRRAAVAEKMGKNSIGIFFSAEPRIYSGDVDFFYRQENNLYYLTQLKQKDAILVMLPGNAKFSEILFLPKRDQSQEIWTGKMYRTEEAQAISGVDEIWDADEFPLFVNALKTGKSYPAKNGKTFESISLKSPTKLYLLLPTDADRREWTQETKFAEDWKKLPAKNFEVTNAQEIFAELRLVKSPMELRYLQHAIDITTEAQERAMATVGRLNWEYEVQAEVEYIFRRRNADYWGYPSIVGCGENATTLHYEESQSKINKGDLLLMDVGAEYEHYTADVTRTFPVNGKFTKEQAEIYQIVYDAQEAVAKAIKPGASFFEVNRAAVNVINERLFALGLITDKSSAQYQIWFPHDPSHWLGMNVHDVGDYSSTFKAGMVFTNEPGIYIRADALENLPKTPANAKFIAAVKPAFEKYKNIGVRIEDDMLVTETGCEWLTKNLPRKIDEIESLMARGEKELTVSELPKQKFAPNSKFFDANANFPRLNLKTFQ